MMNQTDLKLYRRRIIPSETLLLKDDIILKCTDEVIITRWETLNPKIAFHHGCSCYFLKEGIKMSKFYREDNSLLYWYCDIVEYSYEPQDNALTVTDLLADVILYPDGQVKVVDLDELAAAMESGGISQKQLTGCLRKLNRLLSAIYEGSFSKWQNELNALQL